MTLLYRVIVAVLRACAPLLAHGDGKLARGLAGRRHADRVLAAWGNTSRDPTRPTLWIHAPSVGEGLQARAVKDALLRRRPDLQVVFTHFSPSAETLAADFGAGVSSYLPWDLRGPVRRSLEGVEPDVLVFTKTEIWPVLVAEADRRGVRVAMVGATVPDDAGRTRLPARLLLGPAWSALDVACAISEADAIRLVSLGVPEDSVRVTGDPGIDSAANRLAAADDGASYLRPLRSAGVPTVVAGSTWQSDEAVLLPALLELKTRVNGLRMILAPHEPGADVVTGLLRRLEADGWSAVTLEEVEAGSEGWNAVVVERLGVLAHLYRVATASYVGGGFHDAGLHSVLEPAAAASPVVFGPRHSNARAAADLVQCGGAKVATTSEELANVLASWLRDSKARDDTGRCARGYIEGHLGAADRTAEHIERLLTHA